jgi:hypothetical protein
MKNKMRYCSIITGSACGAFLVSAIVFILQNVEMARWDEVTCAICAQSEHSQWLCMDENRTQCSRNGFVVCTERKAFLNDEQEAWINRSCHDWPFAMEQCRTNHNLDIARSKAIADYPVFPNRSMAWRCNDCETSTIVLDHPEPKQSVIRIIFFASCVAFGSSLFAYVIAAAYSSKRKRPEPSCIAME